MPSNVKTVGFDQIPAKAQQGLISGLNMISRTLMQAIKDEAPIDKGDLKASISTLPITPHGAHGFRVRIISDLDKAPHYYYVIFGAKETEITPKTKKALKFLYGGSVVFAGKVVISACPPNNFPLRAILRVSPEITKIITQNFVVRVAQ